MKDLTEDELNAMMSEESDSAPPKKKTKRGASKQAPGKKGGKNGGKKGGKKGGKGAVSKKGK